MTITEARMRGIAAELVDTYVDVDGAAGNQCWDSATYINEHFFGLPRISTWGNGRWPGWAGNMVDAFPQSAAIAAAYELLSPDQPCQPGDTLVWGDSYPAWYPKTHVATCVMDPGNGWPLCLSQNSSTGRPDLPGYSADSTGPVILQSLPKQGLIGIIRPRDTGSIGFDSITTPAAEQDVFDIMTATPEQQDEFIQRLLDHQVTQPDGNKNSLGALLQEYRSHYLSLIGHMDDRATAVVNAIFNTSIPNATGGSTTLGALIGWNDSHVNSIIDAAKSGGTDPVAVQKAVSAALVNGVHVNITTN